MTIARDPNALLNGKRCLVVEDEFLIALDYERVLELAGAVSVMTANRIARAQELITRDGAFDLVLLDLDLDGESSLPFAQTLVAGGIPVVILTGMSGPAALPESLANVPRLIKPFEERTLIAAIGTALG